MRTNRRWLPFICIPAVTLTLVGVLAYASTPTLEATRWTSSHHSKPIPSAQRTMLLQPANLMPIAVFASAVIAAQQQAAAAVQATASATAASTPSNATGSSVSTGAMTAPTTVGSTSPSTTTTTVPAVSTGDPSVYAEWTRVAVCEEGGWIGYAGPSYPDSLGINATNWSAYGGGSDLSPAAQIAVAQRIEAAAGTPGYVPDQGYCASW